MNTFPEQQIRTADDVWQWPCKLAFFKLRNWLKPFARAGNAAYNVIKSWLGRASHSHLIM